MGEEGGLNIRPFATGAIGWKKVGARVRHRGAHFDYANLVGSNSYIRDGNGRITMLVVSGGFVLFIYFIVFSLFSFRIFFISLCVRTYAVLRFMLTYHYCQMTPHPKELGVRNKQTSVETRMRCIWATRKN